MPSRLQVSLAGLSVMASVAPTLIAVIFRLSGSPGGEEEGRILLFTAVPIFLAIIGLFGTLVYRTWVIWTAIGGLWGFAIIGAWSIGLFYVPAALLLSAAGLAHVDARRSWWNFVLVPLWIVEGVSSTAILFLAITVARELLGYGRFVLPGQTREFSGRVQEVSFVPEALTFGAWLFVAATCFLTACHVARTASRSQTGDRRPQWMVIAGILVALVLGAGACRRAMGELQRSGAGGCSSSGGTTICSAS